MITLFLSIRTEPIGPRLTVLVLSGFTKGIRPTKSVLILLVSVSSVITTTMVQLGPTESLTFLLMLSSNLGFHYLVVLLQFMFISLNSITMDITILSFVLLGAIAVAVVSYFAGVRSASDDVALLRAELEGQKLARKEQTRKYDELYDAFLRLNKYNTELKKQNISLMNTYEEAGDEIYRQFLNGVSRKELAHIYPNIAYSTICNWIRRKREEVFEQTANPTDSAQ